MKRCLCVSAFVFCLLAMLSVATAQEKGYGYVSGKITTIDGESMAGGTVRFFDMSVGLSPYTHEYWRGPDYFRLIADDGSFLVQLPEGTYYMTALKKRIGKTLFAPPEEGDLVYPSWDGAQKACSVMTGETTDLGVISEAVPFKKEWIAQGKTGITGAVLDAEGKPVEEALVIASASPKMESPLFTADRRTGKDGKYILRVPEGGQIYVRVIGSRQPIVAGIVITGEITKGINIKLVKTPVPESR